MSSVCALTLIKGLYQKKLPFSTPIIQLSIYDAEICPHLIGNVNTLIVYIETLISHHTCSL